MSVNYKTWQEMLPLALMSYRTSIRTSTRATPYSIVYRIEAVILVDVEIPLLRILIESELEEAEWVRERHDKIGRAHV